MTTVTPGGTRPIRVGDVERDRAVSVLADHFAAGRLDQGEYEERVARALTAVHQHDLGPLFVDLPGSEQFSGQPSIPRWMVAPRHDSGAARQRSAAGPPWPMLFLPLVIVLLIAVVAHTPWLLFLGIWALCLGGGRLRAYRSGRRGPPRSVHGAHWQR